MSGLRWILCGLALSLGACAVSSDDASSAPDTSSQAQEIVVPRALGFKPAAETCTETFGTCKVGQCELGPHDTFQRITEVCCDASGACTTELYRLCGC
jgi:hypothetical protein